MRAAPQRVVTDLDSVRRRLDASLESPISPQPTAATEFETPAIAKVDFATPLLPESETTLGEEVSFGQFR